MAAVKLVSMKRTAKDKREDAGEAAPMSAIAPDYPYGPCINLDKDELDKIGMKQLPTVGSEMGLHVKVKVTRVTSSAVEGEDSEDCVSMQITDMAVVPPGS